MLLLLPLQVYGSFSSSDECIGEGRAQMSRHQRRRGHLYVAVVLFGEFLARNMY
jgi:hypothetical protein